ncbi:MAG: hypothetical protein U5L72_01535 [Bacteroidales bacterium]|nr:hypothetical protein [Bacteroidales bacterium]
MQTTIVTEIQRKATEVVNSHSRELQGNMIFNAACLIVAVDDGRVLAYVGNSRADTTWSTACGTPGGHYQGNAEAARSIFRSRADAGSCLPMAGCFR